MSAAEIISIPNYSVKTLEELERFFEEHDVKAKFMGDYDFVAEGPPNPFAWWRKRKEV